MEAPAAEPLVRLGVRPSDHAEAGLVCLEQADEAGDSWTWTDEAGELSSHDAVYGAYRSGIYLGWATELASGNGSDRDWLNLTRLAAWHLQCSAWHGIDLSFGAEPASGADDWMN